ncbi:MAG: hypothetical protein HEP71_20790 [Roseivirga sp.]|nr:hypothetical protein [Roseivirga sp.]
MKANQILSMMLLALMCACTEEVIFDFEENLSRELEEINDFIARHDFPAEVHSTEIRYQWINEGIGEPIKVEDTVFFNYQIYLLDSTLMDTNLEEVRIANNLPPGNSMPVRDIIYGFSNFSRPGFLNVAYTLGREESKIHMIVPSHEAYGGGGRFFSENRVVPPYTPILVEIEIAEVRPGN